MTENTHDEAAYVQFGAFRVYMGLSGYGVRDERSGDFVDDALTYDEAVDAARRRADEESDAA